MGRIYLASILWSRTCPGPWRSSCRSRWCCRPGPAGAACSTVAATWQSTAMGAKNSSTRHRTVRAAPPRRLHQVRDHPARRRRDQSPPHLHQSTDQSVLSSLDQRQNSGGIDPRQMQGRRLYHEGVALQHAALHRHPQDPTLWWYCAPVHSWNEQSGNHKKTSSEAEHNIKYL